MATGNTRDLYNKDTFIVPITTEDTQVRLRNVEGTIKHTLSPHEVVTIYVQGVAIKIKTLTDIHTLCFATNQEAIEALTLLQLALDQVKDNIAGGPTGGIQGVLGLPTDGAYGLLYPSIAGVAQGDRVEDAFDKVTTFLERFVPAPPPNLSAITMTLASGYTARQESSGVLHNDITSTQVSTLSAPDFLDGRQGVLSAVINSINAGSITLTNGDDTGLTNGNLTITGDEDAYAGSPSEEGFWWQLSADIVTSAPNLLVLGANNISMTHDLTGTSNKTIYLDDPMVPVLNNINISSVSTGSYVSGVPYLGNGDNVTATFDADNVVSEYYHQTNIGALAGTSINNDTFQPGSAPAKGATVNASISTTILNNIYEPGAAYDVSAQASNSVVTTQNVVTNLNIDSISDESPRVESGVGQYPGTYGGAFDSSNSILGNEELQMFNGQYQYPPAVDYSGFYPVGPDYTTVAPGSHNNMRWVTFQPITITNEVAITVDFINTTNFGATALMTGIEIYVKVDGATGWLNANAAYPGVGTPAADGDPALVVGSSTSTSKRVTFSVVRSGQVFVRVGIPSGSNKAFGSINVSV
jgi:hypothetical protein